jgi:Zn-dependent oligopeptidase
MLSVAADPSIPLVGWRDVGPEGERCAVGAFTHSWSAMGILGVEQGLLGYIYADLYSRHNKTEQPSQFTIRSGRRISESEYQVMA